LAKPGGIYAIYLPAGGSTSLDLGNSSATFSIQWYNPRNAGPLQTGSKTEITGPGQVSIGQPPSDGDQPAQPTAGKDWVALVKKK